MKRKIIIVITSISLSLCLFHKPQKVQASVIGLAAFTAFVVATLVVGSGFLINKDSNAINKFANDYVNDLMTETAAAKMASLYNQWKDTPTSAVKIPKADVALLLQEVVIPMKANIIGDKYNTGMKFKHVETYKKGVYTVPNGFNAGTVDISAYQYNIGGMILYTTVYGTSNVNSQGLGSSVMINSPPGFDGSGKFYFGSGVAIASIGSSLKWVDYSVFKANSYTDFTYKDLYGNALSPTDKVLSTVFTTTGHKLNDTIQMTTWMSRTVAATQPDRLLTEANLMALVASQSIPMDEYAVIADALPLPNTQADDWATDENGAVVIGGIGIGVGSLVDATPTKVKDQAVSGEIGSGTIPVNPPTDNGGLLRDILDWLSELLDGILGIPQAIIAGIDALLSWLVEQIKSLLLLLFQPTIALSLRFNNLRSMLLDKIPLITKMDAWANSIIAMINGSNSMPEFYITVPSSLSWLGVSRFSVFDFTWFDQYRDMIHGFILFGSWAMFLIWGLPRRVRAMFE